MMVDYSSSDYLSVTLDLRESVAVCNLLGIRAEDICKVSVNILRWPLTPRICRDNIHEAWRATESESLELFDTCSDPDHT